MKQEADAKAPIGRSRRCSKVVNGVGGVREEEAETKGRRGQGQRGDVEDQRDGVSTCWEGKLVCMIKD